MGYEAPLRLQDGLGQRWVGVHAPQRGDVLPLLSSLLESPDALEDPDAVAACLPTAGGAPVRLGPWVWRVEPEGGAPFVVKVLPPRAKDRRGFGGSLARRAHTRAHQLRAFGLGAPAPIAFVERQRKPRRGASLALSAFVPGPSLRDWWQDSLLPLADADPARFVRTKRAQLVQLARTVRRLHARGIFHGDLHAENLLVTPEGLVVLDLESVRRGPGARRVVDKTLERLERDLSGLGGLTRTDRMRFLHGYLSSASSSRSHRRGLWGRVEARAARRAPPEDAV